MSKETFVKIKKKKNYYLLQYLYLFAKIDVLEKNSTYIHVGLVKFCPFLFNDINCKKELYQGGHRIVLCNEKRRNSRDWVGAKGACGCAS